MSTQSMVNSNIWFNFKELQTVKKELTPRLNKFTTSWRSTCKTWKSFSIQSETLDSSKGSELTLAGISPFSLKSLMLLCLNQQDNSMRMNNLPSISWCSKEDLMQQMLIRVWLLKDSSELVISQTDLRLQKVESHRSSRDNTMSKLSLVAPMPRKHLSKWERSNLLLLEDSLP